MRKLMWMAVLGLVGATARSTETPLSADDLIGRLQVKAEVFALDPSGSRLLGVSGRSSLWTANGKSHTRSLESHWGHVSDIGGSIFMNVTWTVRDDGTLVADLEQFARKANGSDGHHDFTDSLRKQEIQVKDFAPIVWESATSPSDRRVVVRFTPMLADPAPKALERLPLSGTETAVFDDKGHVWADHLTFEGAYVSLMSGEGQLALSYYPFEGATAMGTAGGSRVSVVLPDQRKVTLLSQTDFLPGETRATVYGRFIPDRRGPGVRMMNADREDEFQKALQQ